VPATFRTFGPYELCREFGKVTRKSLKSFWERVSAESGFEDLPKGMGVYVLSTKIGKEKFRPWYVGLTRKQTFGSRFYQHGHNKPNSPFVRLAEHRRKGSVYVFLLPRTTSPTKLMKSTVGEKKRKTKVNSIRELEFMLIGRCWAVNKDLLNVSEKTFQAGLTVPGVVNYKLKRSDKAASIFAAMIQ
jgi:hypothetical protein